MTQTVTIYGDTYQVESINHVAERPPERFVEPKFHFMIGSSNGDWNILTIYGETSTVATSLLNVVDVFIEGEKVEIEEVDLEYAFDKIVQYHEMSTGVIGYSVYLTTEPVEEVTVVDKKVIPE